MKFLSPEVPLYLYKSTIRSRMGYCCHAWAGAPSCYLELDKLQKRIWRTVDPSLAVVITLAEVLQNWLNWFHFLFLEEGLPVILIDCMSFLSLFLDVTRMPISTVSLAQLDSRILSL